VFTLAHANKVYLQMFVASQSEPAQKMVVMCIMSILFVVQGMTLFNPLFFSTHAQ